MASGDVVVLVSEVIPPATLFGVFSTRAGGSTPAEQVPIWYFDAATAWYLDFYCFLKGYAGGGLTFTIPWMAATATTGVSRFGLAIRRIQDDAEDLDTSQTYDFNEVDATTANVSGEVAYDTITFTSGADMDSLANGEAFILRFYRNAAHANDTMAGNAQLLASQLIGAET